jgi:ribosomal protein S18 acetylase RimI-like enzyme
VTETAVKRFEREHLLGAMGLFAAEDWETYTEDPGRTYRALTAPGATTLVALDGDVVAGLVQLQSDGEIQAHLSALVVASPWRRRGLARQLLREALRVSGGMRIDILSLAEGLYNGLGAERRPGFRLRPPELDS